MKKLLFLLTFALYMLAVSAQTRPNKADFNNLLILSSPSDWWYITDLSFNDFNRNVVIETIGYRNNFGEMIREIPGEKREVIRFDAQSNEYRIGSFAIKQENPKKVLEYYDGELYCVYILPEQEGVISAYWSNGAYRNSYEVNISSTGCILSMDKGSFLGENFGERFTYDTNNCIVKRTRLNGDGQEELLKTFTNTWILKEPPTLFTPSGVSKKITILERNEKGLWTRLIIEYMRNPEHNADPVKIEKVRYFDVEENVPQNITQKEETQEAPDIKEEEETTTIVKEEIKEETAKEVLAAEEVVEEKVIPFALVEVKPKFQGGDANTFSKWVSLNLEYPANAKANGVSGRVMVEFIVNTDGSVSDVKVLRGVDPELDAEAIRVIQSSPKWTPGEQRDSPVKVGYQFPVIFQAR